MPIDTADLAVSLDGCTAGPDQSLEHPFGTGTARQITAWMGEADDAAEVAGIVGADATIMGRTVFGPDRGPFDLDWTGWWGEEPRTAAPSSCSAITSASPSCSARRPSRS